MEEEKSVEEHWFEGNEFRRREEKLNIFDELLMLPQLPMRPPSPEIDEMMIRIDSQNYPTTQFDSSSELRNSNETLPAQPFSWPKQSDEDQAVKIPSTLLSKVAQRVGSAGLKRINPRIPIENKTALGKELTKIGGLAASEERESQGCKCSKIDCLKLYCECFAKGKLCGPQCICICCKNSEETQSEIYQAKQFVNMRHPNYFPGIPSLLPTRKCTCKKSLCRKRYCECFSAGLNCTEECECLGCQNCKPNHLHFSKFVEVKA